MPSPSDSAASAPACPAEKTPTPTQPGAPPVRMADLTAAQWKSGAAAWLGWLFDGLDMHLYTLVAAAFVAQLSHVDKGDPLVKPRMALIQGAFLLGWAVGGGFFGWIGDRLGRSRALMLTILTYALFTGLSYLAVEWWHLLVFRFVAALGIGGEWAVGAALLSETWPQRWRPWIAAVLQSAVNIGILLATATGYLLAGRPEREVFLVGILPAVLVLWIRRAVPEPEHWHAAKHAAGSSVPPLTDLFRGRVARTTWLTLIVCGCSLSAHWAFTFWGMQHLTQLPSVRDWSPAERQQLTSIGLAVVVLASIGGNFVAAALARLWGYRKAIASMCAVYGVTMLCCYSSPRDHRELLVWFAVMGLCSGLFGLFTMYLPPLFPTLLRTSGAGFCYNFGRVASALVTVLVGLGAAQVEFRTALLWTGVLFLPAGTFVLLLRETGDEPASPAALD